MIPDPEDQRILKERIGQLERKDDLILFRPFITLEGLITLISLSGYGQENSSLESPDKDTSHQKESEQHNLPAGLDEVQDAPSKAISPSSEKEKLPSRAPVFRQPDEALPVHSRQTCRLRQQSSSKEAVLKETADESLADSGSGVPDDQDLYKSINMKLYYPDPEKTEIKRDSPVIDSGAIRQKIERFLEIAIPPHFPKLKRAARKEYLDHPIANPLYVKLRAVTMDQLIIEALEMTPWMTNAQLQQEVSKIMDSLDGWLYQRRVKPIYPYYPQPGWIRLEDPLPEQAARKEP